MVTSIGTKVGNEEVKLISLLIICHVSANKSSFEYLVHYLDHFFVLSGHRVNVEKMLFFSLGRQC